MCCWLGGLRELFPSSMGTVAQRARRRGHRSATCTAYRQQNGPAQHGCRAGRLGTHGDESTGVIRHADGDPPAEIPPQEAAANGVNNRDRCRRFTGTPARRWWLGVPRRGWTTTTAMYSWFGALAHRRAAWCRGGAAQTESITGATRARHVLPCLGAQSADLPPSGASGPVRGRCRPWSTAPRPWSTCRTCARLQGGAGYVSTQHYFKAEQF